MRPAATALEAASPCDLHRSADLRDDAAPRMGRPGLTIGSGPISLTGRVGGGGAARAASSAASSALSIAESLRRARAEAGVLDPVVAEAQTSLERRIRAHLDHGALSVTLTDNRYTMISVKRTRKDREGRAGHYHVRLHHMFAEASPTITRALAGYIARNDRDASRLLGEFIDGNQTRVRSNGRRPTAPLIVTDGVHHDLRDIYDEVNGRYFGRTIEAVITWGPRNGRPRRRNSIKMGSYSVEDRLIRIHRSLDRAFVPRFFVEWIVYHEMLHQVHDIKVKNGRREFHSKAFLADEARFGHYEAARAWERAHLDQLLTY